MTSPNDHVQPAPRTRELGRTWGLAAALAVVAYVAIFWLPFQFPPKQLLVSASYAFGFNNSVAIVATALLLGLVTAWRVFVSGSRASDPRLHFPDDSSTDPRPGPWVFGAMAGVHAVLTAVMYAYTVGSASPRLTWESRHFLHRIKLIEAFDLQPYTEIHVEYGPALMYPPIYLHRMLAPLGFSVEISYFLCHLLMNVAGLWCLWYLARHTSAPAKVKIAAFLVVGFAGFAPYMGLNGVVLRYAAPFASVLFAHRLWVAQRVGLTKLRWLIFGLIITLLATVNVLISPEIALAFTVCWLAYAVLSVRTNYRLLAVSAAALALTFVGSYLMLPEEYYRSLLRFSQGANNLPMVPAAHLVLYLVTLMLIVPPLLAAGWRGERSDAPLLGSLGVLSVITMAGAFGRCDPPHVLLFGLVASMLLMIRLGSVSMRAHRVYLLAYAGVFIGMMQVVNLVNFFNVPPRDLLTHPAQTIRRVIGEQRAEFAERDSRDVSALDKYPAIGLPFATWGWDNAAEDHLFARRSVDPEFYVGIVGVYTEVDIAKKLADTARHQYLLVDKEWQQLPTGDDGESYLMSIRLWFLYPARLRWVRPDLDSTLAVKRFIAEHYRAVEDVGPSVVVERIDAAPPVR